MALTKIQFTIETDLEIELKRYCANGSFTSRRDCLNQLIRLGLGAVSAGEGAVQEASMVKLSFYS